MPESQEKEDEKQDEEKRTKVGKTLTVSFSAGATLMRLAPEAQKVLDRLDKKLRHTVMQRAIELSEEKGRDYDVRLEDVVEAKEELERKPKE